MMANLQSTQRSDRRWDAINPHIALQCLWNAHAAVGLLIIFDNRNPRAANRERAAIQGVHELRLALAFWTIADIRPPRLKIFKI